MRLLLLSLWFFSLIASEPKNVPIEGQLANGLRYWVLPNAYPEGKALLKLVVKTGSLHEREGEKGIAHLIEHLVFRGSEHFSDHEVVEYLESIGAEFGADANAYTSVNETVYHFDLPIVSPETLEKSLLILSDFAGRAHLSDAVIATERGVVLDELRLRGGPESLAHEEEWNWKFEGTPYADHLPGGHRDDVSFCSNNRIRELYKRNYRPDRMALIAVGDFDPTFVETLIQRSFDSLENPSEDFSEPLGLDQIPQPKQSFVFTHPDLSFTHLFFEQWTKREERDDDDPSIKKRLMDEIIENVFNYRLERRARQENVPFIHASISLRQILIGQINETEMRVTPYPNREREALQVVWQEFQRLQEKGLLPVELDIARAGLKKRTQKAIANADTVSSELFADIYHNHFTFGIHLYDYNDYLKRRDRLLSEIDLESIAARLQESVGLPFSFIACSNAPFDCSLDFMEESCHLPDYVVTYPEFPQVDLSEEGQIVEEVQKGDSLHLRLSNGMEVVLHRSELKKDEVLFSLVARGGFASLDPNYWNEAKLAGFFLAQSDLCGIDPQTMHALCHEKGMNFSFELGSGMRELSGRFSPQDAQELFFNVVRGIFTDRNLSESSFESLRRVLLECRTAQERRPAVQFSKFFTATITNSHPLYSPVTLSALDQDKLDWAIEMALSDLENYTLVLVGDFDVDSVKKYLKSHLASLPSYDLNGFEWPLAEPKIEGTSGRYLFMKGQEEIGLTMITDYLPSLSFENAYQFMALRKILAQRLEGLLRQKLGETYGVNVTYDRLIYPYFYPGLFSVSYSHHPAVKEKTCDLILEELKRFPNKPTTEAELNTVKEILRQDIKEQKMYNQGLLNELCDTVLFGKMKEDRDEIETLTVEQITALAQELWHQIDWNVFTWINEES